MKTLVTALVLGLSVALTQGVDAAPKAKAKHTGKQTVAKHKRVTKTGKKAAAPGELKTDVSFDDSVLHGEYQTPDEALAKVENEKGFGDLVGVRKHFKDRLEKAAEQE